MRSCRLYPEWQEAFFAGRLNRFVMVLEKNAGRIKAYIANPGRMEEYLVPGQPFFVTPARKGRYRFRVVSTAYEGSYILLDTPKVNDIVEFMIQGNQLPELGRVQNIRREVKVNHSRFDFLLEREESKPVLLEVKSCSLCHAGVAMFPDAPTQRGRRHLEELELLANQGCDAYTLYLITNRSAETFMPNCHTDREYSQTFHQAKNVHFLAYMVEMLDPVTIDISTVQRISIDFETSRRHYLDRGSYLLVLYNETAFSKRIGRLGERQFKKGYYVYIGSALNGLNSRIKRHMRKRKKTHWHLDYIFPGCMKLSKLFPISRKDRIEVLLAQRLQTISSNRIPGFGSSDTREPSYLFFFTEDPVRQREFLDALLDFRMFLEG